MRISLLRMVLALVGILSFLPSVQPPGLGRQKGWQQEPASLLLDQAALPASPAGRGDAPLPRFQSLDAGKVALFTSSSGASSSVRIIDPNEQVRVIVQLSGPPLAVAQEGAFPPLAGAQEAIAGILSQHRQFRSDLAALGQRHAHSARGAAQLQAAEILFEYTVALNGFALLTRRWVADLLLGGEIPSVVSVAEDNPVEASDDSSNAVIGSPAFWRSESLHGEGVDIGLLDTGIDYLHEALGAGAFPNLKVVGGYDFVNNDPDPMDDNGHGTHVAGIAAGDGPPPVSLKGVAFRARLWAFKVLNAGGSGFTSAVIAGIDRALDPDGDPSTPTPIKVLSMSLGAPGDPLDPASQAIDNAVSDGIVCIAAAGNSGPAYRTILSPACAEKALAVGAIADRNTVAGFSSRGPAAITLALKPDLIAPGVQINSARMGGGYALNSGTSMAAPHLAGAAALARQLHPAWPALEIRALLLESARQIGGYDALSQGNGRADLSDLGGFHTVIAPASLSFGPVSGSQTLWTKSETLAVANHDSIAEVVNFSLASSPLPAGIAIGISPNPATVPGNGMSAVVVTMTVDQTLFGYPAEDPGFYLNALVARAPGLPRPVTLPLGFVKRPLLHVAADDGPARIFVHDRVSRSYIGSGSAAGDDFLLPPGIYDVLVAWLSYQDGQAFWAVAVRESVVVSGPAAITIARAEARDSITLRAVDEHGSPFPTDSLYGIHIVTHESGFQIGLVGRLSSGWVFSPLSRHYRCEWNVLPASSTGPLYQIPYSIAGGISGPMVLRNDPQNFTGIDYRYNVPDSLRQLSVVRFIGTADLLWGLPPNSRLLDPPFRLVTYGCRQTAVERIRFSFDLAGDGDAVFGGGKPLHISGLQTIVDPGGVEFFAGLESSSPPVRTMTGPKVTAGMCYASPWWSGIPSAKKGAGGDSLVLVSRGLGFFNGPYGDARWSPLPYRLLVDSVQVGSGTLENISGTSATSFPLRAGKNELLFTWRGYAIGSANGVATARLSMVLPASGSGGAIFPPPFLRNFQVEGTGAEGDDRYPREIIFAAGDAQDLQTARLMLRPFGGAASWQLLAADLLRDSVYRALVPRDLAAGYYSVRIVLRGLSGNGLDFTVEPAFEVVNGLSYSLPSLEFDSTEVGCSTRKILLGMNDAGGEHLAISGIVPDDSSFIGSGGPSFGINPGESAELSVAFAPLHPGRISAHLVVSYAGGRLPDSLLLTGTGTGTGTAVQLDASYAPGWNLLSLPVTATCSYPMKGLFAYDGTYLKRDTLESGAGYWRKLSDTVLSYRGLWLSQSALALQPGWNLIGSLSFPFPVAGIQTIPDRLLSRPVYDYTKADGYRRALTVRPGHAYWVFARQEGFIVLPDSAARSAAAPPARSPAGRIEGAETPADGAQQRGSPGGGEPCVLTFTDREGAIRTLCYSPSGEPWLTPEQFLLPPAPPAGAFDARFASGRTLEAPGWEPSPERRILVSGETFPVSVSWQGSAPETAPTLVADGEEMPLAKKGTLLLERPVSRLALVFGGPAALPRAYGLEQNYPNPFNPVTVIRYQLPLESRVTMEVFNLLGQLVARPVESRLEPAGFRSCQIDASAMASGVYFYRLRAVSAADPARRSFCATRRMVLLR